MKRTRVFPLLLGVVVLTAVPTLVTAQEGRELAEPNTVLLDEPRIVHLDEPRIVHLDEPRIEHFEPGVRETAGEEETVVALEADVFFAFDESTLLPEARETLDAVAQQLDDAGVGAFTVAGHTDAVGDDAYNQQLSEERAAAVADHLGELLPDATITASGHGSSQPAAPNEVDGEDYPEGRAANRRVEITFAS